ncbi:M16 family metallopeptidase [Pseudothermotoga sp.]|nr:insulinase family protein [Pseudothermotoga sp.]MCX7812886.1 insulinase family protein [Pseudothermotoga sp.]MDW8139875.1 pitrilysin family protein [Pseudothermotoga sp.]
MKIEITKASNGHIYYVPISSVKTLSLAFIVPVGSANEEPNEAGLAHLIEHAAFKGTKKFDEFTLKFNLEIVGGGLNAFTTKDFTVYFAKVPHDHHEKAIEILSEIVFNPLLEERSIELEKSVIIEEIKTYNEDHESRVQDLFAETYLEEPYSRPVSGYKETVERLNREKVLAFHSSYYGNVDVVAAGKVTKSVLEKLKKVLEANNRGIDPPKIDVLFKPERTVCEGKKDLTQVHLISGTRLDCGVSSEDYPAFMVLSTLLGSGMSSLLFMRIREQLGLVYDVDVLNTVWKDKGIFGVYACTSLNKLEKYVEELKKIAKQDITEDLFEYGKQRLMGKLKMMTESVSSIFGYVLELLMAKGEPLTVDEMLKRIEAVTLKRVRTLWRQICERPWHWVGVVPAGTESGVVRAIED